jgi:nucleoid DNA-binding protein
VPSLLVVPGQEALLGVRGNVGQGQDRVAVKVIQFLRELRFQELQFLQVATALRAEKGDAMTKADLVEQVAGVTGLTKRDVGVVVDLLLETISKALCEKEHIEIRGFGSFKVKTKKARTARNPRTGAQVQVPEKTVPYFKASRELVKLIDSM